LLFDVRNSIAVGFYTFAARYWLWITCLVGDMKQRHIIYTETELGRTTEEKQWKKCERRDG
jgi:hypothetical protein